MPAKPETKTFPTIFISASFFDWAERSFNRKLQETMAAAGYGVILIQENDGDLWDRELFNKRVQGLKQADLVLAVVTGPDLASCVAFDLGLAKAWGIPVLVLKTDFNQRGLTNAQAMNFVIQYGSESIVPSGPDFFDSAIRVADSFFKAG